MASNPHYVNPRAASGARRASPSAGDEGGPVAVVSRRYVSRARRRGGSARAGCAGVGAATFPESSPGPRRPERAVRRRTGLGAGGLC